MFSRVGNFKTVLVVGALLALCSPLFAEDKSVALYDTTSAQEQSRARLVQEFIRFTQDKNVMGKSKDASGKTTKGGPKTRFNQDDGLAYQSDLTYHDFSFNTDDEEAKKADPKDPKAAARTLYSFISEHGGIAEGGGSSLLERVVYENHTKYSKQDEDPDAQKKQDQEEGVKFRSVFRVDTREVFPDAKGPAAAKPAGGGAGAGAGAGADKGEPEKVERTTLRPDVKQAIEQVGTQSFDTIERAAKDTEEQDDPNALGGLTFYYEAAARATKAMWDSTLANLSQRRINRAIRGDASLLRPTLSEGMPGCAAWVEAAKKELEQIKEPARREAQEQEIQKMQGQCQELSQASWKMVDPKYETPEQPDDGGGGAPKEPPQPQLVEKGPDKEDDKARDLRNTLVMMDKVGSDPSKLQTNWKYDDEEFKASITVGMDEKKSMTNKEQLEDANQAKLDALKAIQEVKKVAPEYQFDESALSNSLYKPGEQNIFEINRVPPQLAEEMGSDGSALPPAQNYEELVQQASQE